MSQLKAPNGKPSNLTPEQWKLVRTPQFKAWFGDWENDPENASKIVDENGEPLVVYHGSRFKGNIYKFKHLKEEKLDWTKDSFGFYFSDDKDYAKGYGENIYQCFLNIKNPKLSIEFEHTYLPYHKIHKIINDGYDGVYFNGSLGNRDYDKDIFYEKEIVAFDPEQIKLADGSNTTFDGKNPDIRFAQGGTMNTIQQGDALIYKDSEFLDFDNVIYVEHTEDTANGTLVGLSNGQTMFLPQVLKKFRKANEGEINRSNIMSKEIFSKGGKTRRYMKKIKRGGITYGKSHAEGGIPVKNQSTGDMLEVEGGEGIVNKRSMASDKKVKLNGKEMTICEAVSQLNQLEGGVQFSCDDVEDRQFIEAMARGGELERGVRTEQEHIQVLKDLYAKRITPKQASKRIAKDHLKEDAHYYSKLSKMEGKMADGGMSEDLSIYVNYFRSKPYEYEKVTNMKTLNMLKDNGFIEFTSETGKDRMSRGSMDKVNWGEPPHKIRPREIKSAISPTFKFKGKEYIIGYEKGTNFLHFYVLKKGEEWDRYHPQEKMAKGGEIFDKETEDLLSDLTKKYAKGGEVVADKTETINMKDFEGYADQYNGRKNKFFKANDEYQLLVNEGMELKNNTTLPQDEKDKLLAELREKAREAKTTLGEKRKDFVEMREVKSPFYAPQLADGGIFTSLPKAVRVPHELKEIVKSKSEFPIDKEYQFYISKSERFPKIISKGISAKFKLVTLKEGLSTRIYFSISSKATYEKDDVGVWENVAKTLQIIPSLKNDISSISVNKIARGYDVYFFITKPLSYIDIYNITANVVQNLIDYQSFISLQKLFKVEEKTTIPPTIPTHKKEDDWNWRFKTEDELRAELGGDLYASKDGNVFATSMRYLLGKKINETQEAVEAISKINQKIYGGVGTIIQKQLGIETPTKDSRENWVISKWMITNKPLAGESVPPTEEKKYISVKEVEEELMRWTAEKVEEKNGLNSLKYQTPHLLRYILLNQARGKMSDFTQLIAMAKQSEKVNGEMVRLSNEGLPVDGFVMQLMYKKVLQLIEDIKAQIMLFVKYESDVKQELDRITFHIPYLAELDTFDKDYITHIK